MTYNPPEMQKAGTIATIILLFIVLIGGLFAYNYYQDKQRQQNFNICDENWFNKRFSTSLPNENIPFRDATSLNYIKECSNK